MREQTDQGRVSTRCRAEPEAKDALQLRVELSAEEVAGGVEFGKAPDGALIVVTQVAPGSAAEQAGIREGQKLLAISSPMLSGAKGETWDVTARSSLRFVRDAIRMTRSADVTLVLSRALAGEESGNDSSSEEALASILGSDDEEGQTVAEKLARTYKEQEEAAFRQRTQRERRVQRRKEYMERESNKDQTAFFLGLIAAFFLPALGILVYAFSSGLLDSINSGYRPY